MHRLEIARVSDMSSSSLQARLDAVFGGIERKRVALAYRSGGASSYAAIGSDSESPADASEWTLQTGCITKLFTAALIDREVRSGRIGVEDPVSRFVDAAGHARVVAGRTI